VSLVLDFLYQIFIENILLFSLFSLVMAFIASYRIIPLVVYISIVKNLTAKPNERSSHVKNTPHLGGLAISFGTFFVSELFGSFILPQDQQSLMLAISVPILLLFTVGFKDDIVGLSPLKKLFVEIISAFIFIVLTDVRISSFFGLFGLFELPLLWSYVFTIFTFVIIINSYNLIDGIYGLAALLAILILFIFLVYFIHFNYLIGILSTSALIGSLMAFFRFNVSHGKRKIFMGDTGSLIVGFLLSVFTTMILSMNTPQDEIFHNKPVIILAIFAFPFLDTFRVFFVRLSSGLSPFKADKNHLHHKLLKYGFSHLSSSLIIIFYCVLVFVFGLCFQAEMILNHLLLTLVFSIGLMIVFLKYFSKSHKVKK
jgi:UDP-N-acetylmuramyl pentapeptide phosphotransferase/UDP-N-acetylglucosamine-1-phosphate transferase